MKILFINSDDDERDLYNIYLENTIADIEITSTHDAQQALSYISQNDYNLIIASDKIENGTPGNVFSLVREKEIKPVFILLGTTLPDDYPELEGYKGVHRSNTHILQPVSPKDFRQQVLTAISPSRSSIEKVSAFHKIKVNHFFRFNKVKCDIYVKLSDRKYVKVLNKDSFFCHKDLHKFKEKDIHYFYITNNDFESFQVHFSNKNFLLQDTSKMSTEKALDTMGSTHLVLHEQAQDVGISKKVIEIAQNNVKNVVEMVQKNPDLSELFNTATKKSTYLYDHSYLTAIVACNIFHKLNWDTVENLNKICTAAVLHDLFVENNGTVLLSGVEDTDLSLYSKAEQEIYMEHPKKIADELDKLGSIQNEVIDMVLHHHESPTGKGIFKIPASRLSMITCTFIIAHEYVRIMYQHDFEPSKHAEVISHLKTIYNVHNFIAPMTSFDIPSMKTKQLAA